MIKDAVLKDLTVHADERGKLFEILRSDEEIFSKFGQTYVTVCNPGWVKGWHYHRKQTDNFCTIRGRSRVVLYDLREGFSTKGELNEFVMDAEKPQLLRIPKGVVHGFECVGDQPCWIMNVPTEPYNGKEPDEFRYPLDSPEIPYEPWKKRKGY